MLCERPDHTEFVSTVVKMLLVFIDPVIAIPYVVDPVLYNVLE